jgi:hypothetical protein
MLDVKAAQGNLRRPSAFSEVEHETTTTDRLRAGAVKVATGAVNAWPF